MTYVEYLKQNGATEEEIKILDVAFARKAYDAMVARVETATAEAAAEKQKMASFKEETDNWYNNTIVPNYTKMEREAAAAKANEARAVALIKASTDEGLKKVAADMGYVPAADPTNPNTPNPNPTLPALFDPSKYVSVDRLNQLSMDVGAGLAALQDMVLEHGQLFPDRPLNVRKIREEALAAKKDVYSYWTEKYKVDDARTARASAATEAHDKSLREEGAKSERERLATQYGSPDIRPMSTSTNPFAPRPDRDRTKQPWEQGDMSTSRVQHATKAVMDSIAGKTN